MSFIFQKKKKTRNPKCVYNRAKKLIKQKLRELKGKTEKPTIMVGDFNTTESSSQPRERDRKSASIKNKNTVNQPDPADIYRICHPTGAHTFFSGTHQVRLYPGP